MEALDTNLLVRLATRDDATQVRKVERLMREKFSAQFPAWISVIVVTEMAWVLARSYGYTRPQIASSIRGLLDVAGDSSPRPFNEASCLIASPSHRALESP